MAKKKIIEYVLIISLVALLVTTIVLGILIITDQNKFKNEVEFSENGTTTDSLNINITDLYPTKSAEYSATFKSLYQKTYVVTLAFYSDENIELAQYLDTTMEINGKDVSSGLLSDYLNGKTIEVDLPLTENNSATFTLRCTMPSTVGDEAQSLSADFTMEITANPKE
jgi:hypothetical protein